MLQGQTRFTADSQFALFVDQPQGWAGELEAYPTAGGAVTPIAAMVVDVQLLDGSRIIALDHWDGMIGDLELFDVAQGTVARIADQVTMPWVFSGVVTSDGKSVAYTRTDGLYVSPLP